MLNCFPLFTLAALTVFTVTSNAASEPISPPQQTAAKEFLDSHNKARAEVSVDPLQWSNKLEKDASLLVRYQRNKMECEFANLTASKYGGNQLWSGSTAAVTPSKAVEEWVKEKSFYIHANNSCVGNHECGVYTQVVWKNTSQVGCAQATCMGKKKASLTICFYDPPGNVIGEAPY